jgi:predicted nucleotidyltransferase
MTRISLSDRLHGYTLREIRHLLRYMRDDTAPAYVAELLVIGDGQAKWLCDALVRSGQLQRSHVDRRLGQLYTTTVLGNALAMARATPPVSRAKAERVLAEFLDRVRQLEARDDLLYRVARVVVFGSYLTDAETLGDVDLGIAYVSKLAHLPWDERRPIERAFIDTARAEGRTFSNYGMELTYPRTAVVLFLKHRSRVLSLHDLEDDALFARPELAVREVWPEG